MKIPTDSIETLARRASAQSFAEEGSFFTAKTIESPLGAPSERNSEAQLKTVLASIAVGVSLFDVEQRMVFANPQYGAMYDLPPSLLQPGTPLSAIVAERKRVHSLPDALEADFFAWLAEEANTRPTLEQMISLSDGRTIRIHCQRTEGGGWVVTHDDVTREVERERSIRESEDRFAVLARNSSDVIILGHFDGRRTYYSPAVERMTGYTPEEALNISMKEWVHPEDLQRLFSETQKLSRKTPNVTIAHRLRRKDGCYIWTESAFALVEGAGHEPYVVANIRDISARKAIEEEYRTLFENSTVAVHRTSLNGKLLRANPAMVRMFGYDSEQELIEAINSGKHIWRGDMKERADRIRRIIRDGKIVDHQAQFHNLATGDTLWISENSWLVHDSEGRPLHIEGTGTDITARVAAQETLERVARRDSLTGLLNRFGLKQTLADVLTDADRKQRRSQIFLLYIDLDRFKPINDTFGHAAGDELLTSLAERLSQAVGRGYVVSRIGGDEFAIVLTSTSENADAMELAKTLMAAINRPVRLSCSHVVSVGASIGITQALATDQDAEDLLRRADLAMFDAKRGGRNKVRFYDEGLDAHVQERQALEVKLRQAIATHAFELHYQPLFAFEREELVGFEALVRWRTPEGLVAPGGFLQFAEETGLIVPIGEMVIDQAMASLRLLPKPLRLAINTSVPQLRHPNFLQVVKTALQRHSADPKRVEFEITETALIDDSEETTALIEAIRALGMTVSLDDFGTGWASLGTLSRQNFDRMKIDKSLVHDAFTKNNDAILRAIVDMGSRLGIAMTAEGIETEEHYEKLRLLGCHECQGYWLGKPMPLTDALDFAKICTNHQEKPSRPRE